MSFETLRLLGVGGYLRLEFRDTLVGFQGLEFRGVLEVFDISLCSCELSFQASRLRVCSLSSAGARVGEGETDLGGDQRWWRCV